MNPKYPKYKDTCCHRVCRALNYSGDPVPAQGGGIPGVRTDPGADKKHYVYSTYDMRKYLNGRYGFPKKFPATATADDVKEYQGIIAYGYLHIDLWNLTEPGRLIFFGSPAIANDAIYIWPTFSVLDIRK